MTIKELLALCRDHGYEGDSSRASLKEWMQSEDCSLEFKKGGKSVQFDDLWPQKGTKGITLTVGKNDAEPDTVEVVEGTPSEPAPPAEMEAAAAAPKARQHDPDATKANRIGASSAGNKAFAVGRHDVMAYKHRIKQRDRGGFKHIKQRAVFDDIDRAEYIGAAFRFKMCSIGGVPEDAYTQKARDMEIVGKGATGSVNAQGGATFMGEFVPELIVLLNEYGAARRLLGVKSPTGAPPYTYPRRTADPTMAWVAAGGAASDQNPAYDNVAVNVGKMLGIMYVDNELLQDSAINVVDDLLNGFANAITYQEDLAFFLGDGTSTYGGFWGLASAIGSAGTKTQGTGSTWAAIVDGDLQAMIGLIPSYAHKGGNLKITCTPAAFYNIFNRLAHAAGGITYFESQAGVVTPAYNGFPVVFNDVMASATATSTLSAYMGNFDFGAKAVEIPGSQALESSEHYRWANDQLTLRSRERFGLNVHDAGDSTNAGPIVALKTGS